MSQADTDWLVHEDIARALTLPARAFTEREFLDRELETLFSRAWLLVPQPGAEDRRQDPRALAERLKVRGSRWPFAVLDKPLFLQRGWRDQALRCFPNVCTHAWYPLVSGPGRGHALACGQHGRRFDCEGRFVSQPGFKPAAGEFPGAEDHLRAFPVERWGPLLFICLGEPLAPLSAFLREFQDSSARLPLERLRPKPQAGEMREVEGNWKQHAWNYMDKFHIGFIHKAPGGLADAVDIASYRTELYEYSALQWVYARDPEHGFHPRLLPERFRDPRRAEKRVFALWWLVFPNLAFNFYPWGLSINAYMPVPGKPERTLFLWYHYSLDDALYERREELWLSEQVDQEDLEALAQVRRGAGSGLAPRGRFSPEEEAGPHWLHRMVSRALLGQPASSFAKITDRDFRG